MKKIILLFLIIGLFLISGCAEKVDEEKISDDTPDIPEDTPEAVEEIQETMEDIAEVLSNVSDNIDEELINSFKEKIQENKNKFAMTMSYFEIKRKDVKTLYFGVMNQEDETSDFTIEFFCDEAMDSRAKPETDIIFEYTDTIEGLGKDQVEVFPLVVNATEDAKSTKYRCRALVGPEGYAERAFFIEVVNP